MSKQIPQHLHAAYDWIDCAGEWTEALSDPDYPSDAYANALEHDQTDVTEADLYAVIEWYRGNRIFAVYDYETGERLPHGPTPELVRESLAEQSGTGAVGAYLAGGEWRWLDAGDPAPCGAEDCRTVYVI